MISEQSKRSLHDRISRGRRRDDCWLWLGRNAHPSKGWYTTVFVEGRRYNLRRLLYALRRGLPALPARTVRLVSKCRNPRCVNPQHMQAVEPPP